MTGEQRLKDLARERATLLKGKYDTPKERKNVGKRIKVIDRCVLYLEKLPDLKLIERQISEINDRIKNIDTPERFGQWSPESGVKPKNPRAQFLKESGISKMRKQVADLKMILHG